MLVKVAIIDYGMGNLFSVQRACEHANMEALITSEKEEILSADAIILPGVGAFGDAMRNIRKLDLAGLLKDLAIGGKPFMGICLGMQLMMSESEEFGSNRGLDVFTGKVIKFPEKKLSSDRVKVPQVGWNKLKRGDIPWENTLLSGIDEGEFMYFIHSFYVVPQSKDIILSITDYEGIKYCSSIVSGNIFACQFHPERSAEKGLDIYKKFAKKIGGKNER